MGAEHLTDNNIGPDRVLPTGNVKTSEPDGCIRICKNSSDVGYELCEPTSVYTFFKESSEQFKDRTALMVKRDGIWRKWTYSEYFKESCTAAKGFIKLGLDRFYGVCIMGYNSPEWMIANFGTIFAGGLSSGVYTTNSPEACRSLADNCRAQIVIVENKRCLDKFLAIKEKLPDIKAMIQWSGEISSPDVISWDELMKIGAQESDEILQQRLSQMAVNQCCTLIYTSGTTGPPKGVMLSHDHMVWISMAFRLIYEYTDNYVVSYLPFSHLAAQIADMYTTIAVGATVYIAPPDALKGTLGALLIEARPTVFLGVPRIWEKMYAKLNEAFSSAGFVKKSLLSWAMFYSLNYYKALQQGRELSSFESWMYYAAKSLVLNKVKERVGLDRSQFLVTGSAPLSVEVQEFFYSLDLPIMEGYGLSESLGTCALSLKVPQGFKLGSVGKIRELNEVKLKHSDGQKEGEICIRGRNVCMGYLRMPELTDEAIDDDGWLYSGDLGWIDEEGFLYITGRLKELIITSGGENIPPILIEEAVKKELPCISNAMAIGDKRKNWTFVLYLGTARKPVSGRYLSILLTFKSEMSLETGEPLQELTLPCQNWLLQNGCEAKTVAEAIKEIEANPDGSLAKAIQDGINRYNEHHAISNAQKLQRWAFLPHDFSLYTNELNNTLKLKRSFVAQKYADIIDAMYSAADQLPCRF